LFFWVSASLASLYFLSVPLIQVHFNELYYLIPSHSL
jgi:hypothetical protein